MKVGKYLRRNFRSICVWWGDCEIVLKVWS